MRSVTQSNMVKIDGEKLYAQIRERGFIVAKICNDVHVNSGYFATAKSRGTIATIMTILLESRYGIPRNSYIIEDEKESAVVEVVTNDFDFFSEENQKKLYKLVYSAMYSAMKHALSE